jgi:hypothetical protein
MSRAESSRPSMRAKLPVPAKLLRTAQIGNTGANLPVLTGPGYGPCYMQYVGATASPWDRDGTRLKGRGLWLMIGRCGRRRLSGVGGEL